MSNLIAQRIYDYLKDLQPFTYLTPEVLLRISGRVEVLYLPPDRTVFKAGDPAGTRIYLVREGSVELFNPGPDGKEELVDRCGEGELFGIRPLLAEEDYALNARTAEETLIYAIELAGFRQLLDTNPRLAHYLANVMAGTVRRHFDPAWRSRLNTPQPVDETGMGGRLLELQAVERARKPVTCTEQTTIRAAAEIMTEHNVGSIIIVDGKNRPLGILTDRDLRRNVVTGVYGIGQPVGEVMTKPVVTVPPDLLVADVQIAMVNYDIHHLVITGDGTPNSPVTGVISEHDLLVLQGNNPAVITREITRASSAGYLRELRVRAEQLLRTYLENEVAISYILTIMTTINDGIIRQAITLSLREMAAGGRGKPPAEFCYLSLGSQGRAEQLLRTDQDSALVFRPVPAEEHPAVKEYFLELSRLTTDKLRTVGYAYCPGDMMAGNPRWCLNLPDWQKQFREWITEPTDEAMLHASVFFDFRPVYGDFDLAKGLTEGIFDDLENSSAFLTFLAQAALRNPPPLTFFRNFVVESSGENKDRFDIKKRVMLPLADAARLLALNERLAGVNSTIQRFHKLAELEPQNAALYRDAAEAYESLIRIRGLMGLRRQDSGRYFKPSELSRLQRLVLRNSFRPVTDLQTLVRVRFQLNLLR